jgi:hypothetical protein
MRYIDCKLPVKHRLVYSYLCYRHNIGKTTSHRQLSELGMSRLTTLPKIVKGLINLKLLETTPKGLKPLPPNENTDKFFKWKTKHLSNKWWRNLAYRPIKLRSGVCELNQIEHLLYWTLVSRLKWGRQLHAKIRLADLVGCEVQAIGRAIKGLESKKIISVKRSRSGLWIESVKDCPDDWWIDKKAPQPIPVKEPSPIVVKEQKPRVKEQKAQTTWKDIAPEGTLEGSIDEMAISCLLKHNIKIEHIKSLMADEDNWLALVSKKIITKCDSEARKDHYSNDKNAFNNNYSGLFAYKLNQILKRGVS